MRRDRELRSILARNGKRASAGGVGTPDAEWVEPPLGRVQPQRRRRSGRVLDTLSIAKKLRICLVARTPGLPLSLLEA